MRCLFLLGAHRSGTTWLHHLLAGSRDVDVLRYAEIRRLLHRGERPLATAQLQGEVDGFGRDRCFDAVEVRLDTPEEYGFLLARSGMDVYSERPISNVDFAPLVSLVAGRRLGADGGVLLLKNPVDFYDGFLRLAAAFPDAGFVVLHRHPWALFRSQVLAWRQLALRRNAYLASLDRRYAAVMDDPVRRTALQFSLHSRAGLERMLFTLAEAFDFHLAHGAELPSPPLQLRYEDLCVDPAGELSRLTAALGVAPAPPPAARLAASPRELQADPLIREVFEDHAARFQAYRASQGYARTDPQDR